MEKPGAGLLGDGRELGGEVRGREEDVAPVQRQLEVSNLDSVAKKDAD